MILNATILRTQCREEVVDLSALVRDVDVYCKEGRHKEGWLSSKPRSTHSPPYPLVRFVCLVGCSSHRQSSAQESLASHSQPLEYSQALHKVLSTIVFCLVWVVGPMGRGCKVRPRSDRHPLTRFEPYVNVVHCSRECPPKA